MSTSTIGLAAKSFIDIQNDVTLADVHLAIREGFGAVEHVKRYTTAGMGIDQGKTGNLNVVGAIALHNGIEPGEVGTTTFRSPYVPIEFGAMTGIREQSVYLPYRHTPITQWNKDNGACMYEAGARWRRPGYYPRAGESFQQTVDRECLAVRENVAVYDGAPLGKFEIKGPDALKFIEMLYTNNFSNLKTGMGRYGIMLSEDGLILDDGVTTRLADNHYFMSTSTGHADAVNQHMEFFLQTQFARNLPATLAALEVWNGNILGYGSLAIIPYSYRLRLLPAYLQQLIMESNGKSHTLTGTKVQHSTAPLIWGTAGTEGQHSYHQWLLQGTQTTPVDFILPLGPRESESSLRLASHCIAQSKALMEGKRLHAALSELLDQGLTETAARAIAPHKTMPGNSPSNTLIMDGMTPANLGALLAMYEHKTFFTSVLWNINAYDQWGVELGKQLSRAVRAQLTEPGPAGLDASSDALIAHLHAQLG